MALVWTFELVSVDLVTDHETLKDIYSKKSKPSAWIEGLGFAPSTTIITFAMCPRERVLQMPCKG